jgi:hypothetical protein
MNQQPDDEPTPSRVSTDISAPAETAPVTLRHTLDDYRAGTNVLHFNRFGFFVQAWRIFPHRPLNPVAVGSLFVMLASDDHRQPLDQPRCILGGDPTTPCVLNVQLVTSPQSPLNLWTADELSSMELFLHVPAVVPWIESATSYHLAGRHQRQPHSDASH